MREELALLKKGLQFSKVVLRIGLLESTLTVQKTSKLRGVLRVPIEKP